MNGMRGKNDGRWGVKQSSLGKQQIFRIMRETTVKINSRISCLHKTSRTNNLEIKLFLEGLKKMI